jgi:hypothetical protein
MLFVHLRLRRLRLSRIFPHFLTNGTIFEKNLSTIKCVFIFSLKILPEIFLILRRIQRDMTKILYWSSRKVPAIIVRF